MNQFQKSSEIAVTVVIVWLAIGLRLVMRPFMAGCHHVVTTLSRTFGTRQYKALGFVATFAIVVLAAVRPPPPDAVAISGQSQGQASNEIEQWRTIIRNNTQQIHDVEESVLGLRIVFRDEATTLKAELGRYHQDPLANRRDMQIATASFEPHRHQLADSVMLDIDFALSGVRRHVDTGVGRLDLTRKFVQEYRAFRETRAKIIQDRASPVRKNRR